MDTRLTELERQLSRARRQVRTLLTALAVVVAGVGVALTWPHALAADPAPPGKGKAAPPDRMQGLFDLSVQQKKLHDGLAGDFVESVRGDVICCRGA